MSSQISLGRIILPFPRSSLHTFKAFTCHALNLLSDVKEQLNSPGQAAQLVIASSQYAKVAGPTPSWEHTRNNQ